MWLSPPLPSPFPLCSITPLIPPHLPPPSTKPSPFTPSLPPLPPWASELDCLPFGFPLFLPSSVPPLIAPLFLTSQGCQLSGHSWKIHSRHGNCKQTERARERDVGALLVTDRKQSGGTLSSISVFVLLFLSLHIYVFFIAYPVAPLLLRLSYFLPLITQALLTSDLSLVSPLNVAWNYVTPSNS